MKTTTSLLTSLSLTILLAAVCPAQAANPHNLADGARGKMCLSCHADFGAVMKKKFIHTPLSKGDCTGCHNPHAADHGKLLSADGAEICLSCHDGLIPNGAASAHSAAGGACVTCHDPHASENRMNLVKPGSRLCFGCHAELEEKVGKSKVRHAPVADDCMTCHLPHASLENPSLLKESLPGLCLECHDASKKVFRSQHVNYPVDKANCVSCHDPHGSNSNSILYDNVHEPLGKRMCDQCHEAADSANPLATKKESFELCQGCHYEMIGNAFNKSMIHWPAVDHRGCLNCHTPHASAEDSLLQAPMKKLCGNCHDDTMGRQERALTKHQPIDEGACSECHAPHSAERSFMLKEKSSVALCAKCHDWQTHSTHPIGDGIVDPRNPSLGMDCLSCHRTHGTEYKHFIYNPTINDLCVQCHTNLRR